VFFCKVENTRHAVLELTQNETNFQVINITGLNPPNAQVNMTKIAGIDGSSFNSATVNTRNIVLVIKLNGDIEKNRIKIYSFFRTKEWCKFYYRNSRRDVFIEAYTDAVECDLFTNNEVVQVSLICPKPFFKDLNEFITDISKVVSMFEFSFAISDEGIEFSSLEQEKITNVYNNSEIETGLMIEIDIYGDVEKIQINNVSTGDMFILNYGFRANDKVIINTIKGEKSINLVRNAETINIFSAIDRKSTFFQLNIGDNFFSYLANEGEKENLIHILFKNRIEYGGV